MELIPYPIFEFYAKENWNEFAANDTPCFRAGKRERKWRMIPFSFHFTREENFILL